MRKQREILLVYPKLYNAKGDLSKQWFVYFYFKNPYTNKLERFKVYDGIIRIQSVEIRTEYAMRLIKNLKAKLQKGYNPFDKKTHIYYDESEIKKASYLFTKLVCFHYHFFSKLVHQTSS